MYEFTGRATRVLELAREFSKDHNYSFIGTEHILYGLVKEGSGVFAGGFKPARRMARQRLVSRPVRIWRKDGVHLWRPHAAAARAAR